MTTGIEFLKPEKKRTGRGLGKKPALFNTSLRLSKEVMDYSTPIFHGQSKPKLEKFLPITLKNKLWSEHEKAN